MKDQIVSLSGSDEQQRNPATGASPGVTATREKEDGAGWFEQIDTSALSPEQRTALWCLLKGRSKLGAVAAAAGVPIETLRAWMDFDRRFKAAIAEARRLIIANRELYAGESGPRFSVSERVLLFLGIV
jgi:hypothetical protein